MPLLQWNERFVLGIEEIDEQHRELMHSVNTLYDEFKGGAAVPALKTLLGTLVSQTNEHFRCEEQWMKETSFPDLAAHVKEHEKFQVRVAEIDSLFGKGLDSSLDLMLFLNNWIRHHLIEVDARFADHIITLKGNDPTLPFHLKVKRYLSS
jgi:hemerythrin